MIAAVVLAAGTSSRMGRPKQLLPVGGKPLLLHAVDAVHGAGCSPVIVVLGAHAERIEPLLDRSTVTIVQHDGWANGMGSSIAAGVEALAQGEPPAGVVLTTCDQPGITAAVIARLIDGFDGTPGRRVAAEYAGTVGVPALFERSLLPELARLEGDRGARSVLTAAPERLVRIPWEEGAVQVNTPDDYAAL